jgi:hypothetical protein
LSLIEGEVSMAPAGTQEWGEAVVNRPLTSEDRLWVDRGARAELQIGSATIHLDASTEFSFIDLDDDAMTMKLTEGRATIRILRKREREDIEINTPNASIALVHPGEYHIEVDEDGEETIVKARSGEAEVAGEGKSYTVRANDRRIPRFLRNWRRHSRPARGRHSRTGRTIVRVATMPASSRCLATKSSVEDLTTTDWCTSPNTATWRPTQAVAGWPVAMADGLVSPGLT